MQIEVHDDTAEPGCHALPKNPGSVPLRPSRAGRTIPPWTDSATRLRHSW